MPLVSCISHSTVLCAPRPMIGNIVLTACVLKVNQEHENAEQEELP
jgi:hypothetical protein